MHGQKNAAALLGSSCGQYSLNGFGSVNLRPSRSVRVARYSTTTIPAFAEIAGPNRVIGSQSRSSGAFPPFSRSVRADAIKAP